MGRSIGGMDQNGIIDNHCNRENVEMNPRQSTRRRTITIFTIGANEKTAEEFFKLLMDAGVRRIVDVRLNNDSTLLGFTRRAHLPYLLLEVAGIGYEHRPDLAPTRDILNAWRNKEITWKQYAARFNLLLRKRTVETSITPDDLNHACLLCSEPAPEKCHRRLVAEYLREKWSDRVAVEIIHL